MLKQTTLRCMLAESAHGDEQFLPTYATPHSAGADLRAAVSQPVQLQPGETAKIPSGLHISLEEGFEAQIRPRSGLAAKNGVTCLNSPGTIDADYRGEIQVILINHGSQTFTIKRGERIAQMVVAPYIQAVFQTQDTLDETQRGHGGFGSTGTD